MTRHLLVVGAQRCGTTYLHDLLAAHPAIAMARPARPEPKVFCSAELAARGRQWYEDTWFAHASDETLLGEKSTSYLEHPEAAERAARVLGDPLILVQLRDPVERAVSNWAFSSAGGLEERPLARALEENLRGSRPWDPRLTSVSPFAYLERGHYVAYLRPWLDRFGPDVTVGFLEELVAGPGSVADLFRAVGVDDTFRPKCHHTPVNEADRGGATLDPELRARLRAHFRSSDRALAELLGRPLPWDPERTREQ